MRILLLDQYGDLGGAQCCLLDAALGFRARGWQLHAAVPEGPLLDSLRPLCASARPIACGPFHSIRKTAGDAMRMAHQICGQAVVIRRVIRETAIDLVYVNGPRLMPAAAAAYGHCAVVFHAHSIVTEGFAASLVRAGIRGARATVLASSRFVADCWPGVTHIVLNGVRSCERIRRRGPMTVAVLGRIAPEKGQLEFVRAVRRLAAVRDCRFVIAGTALFAGNAYEDRVRAEAHEAGIEFTGWVENVPEFLAGVDILVVPSDGRDATPRVIPEAFSAGTAVIAFAVGGIPELIRDGVDGILIRERSPEALASAIRAAIDSPEHLAAIAERARLRWREAFTVERYQEDVSRIIHAAAQRRHQRNPLASTGAIAEA